MSNAVLRAADRLERIWRDPDPESWRHVDEITVVEAIEKLCEAVGSSRDKENKNGNQ